MGKFLTFVMCVFVCFLGGEGYPNPPYPPYSSLRFNQEGNRVCVWVQKRGTPSSWKEFANWWSRNIFVRGLFISLHLFLTSFHYNFSSLNFSRKYEWMVFKLTWIYSWSTLKRGKSLESSVEHPVYLNHTIFQKFW